MPYARASTDDAGLAMAKAELKTKVNAGSIDAFLAIVPAAQAADARAVIAMMERVSGAPPRMWGPAIIGFGSYHYRYDSGREGEMCRIGLSPRKANLTLYIAGGINGNEAALARLGKHSTGKGCLYIKRLGDVDAGVLEAMIATAWAHMAEAYP